MNPLDPRMRFSHVLTPPDHTDDNALLPLVRRRRLLHERAATAILRAAETAETAETADESESGGATADEPQPQPGAEEGE